MKKFRDFKLGTKLICVFLVAGVVPLAVLSFLAVSNSGKAISGQVFKELEAVREIKKYQIESFFKEQATDINVLAEIPFTAEAIKEMDTAFDKEGGVKGGNFTGGTKGEYKAPASYRKVHEKYFPMFKYYMEQYGYYDIFLMCPDHGDTFFTVTKESDFGKRAGRIDSSLRDVWRAAANQGKTAISDTRPYAPSNDAPAQFVAAPVKENGEIIGVIALQLSIREINNIMQERSGMGKTGEAYLVGPDHLMRSDSYLDPDNHSVKASFENPAEGRVETEAAELALSGESGEKIITDYNGNTVLSAYTPVKFGNTTWALLTEIDKSEALASIKKLELEIAIITLAAVFCIVILALFFSRSITIPVRKGVEMAGAMAKGDLTQTLDIRQKDEIGELAESLNSMSGSLRKMFKDIANGIHTLTSSATQLATASDQITSNSEQTADRSSSVASAAEEMSTNMGNVAAATEQTSSNIQMIVSAAEEMSSTIKEIADNTARGNETTSGAVEKAKDVSVKVDNLGKAAEEISKVTETISDISEQTNLLALNATIEAARAGEAGKGFAVVAGEIKALAQQTAEATRDIGEKIMGVQETTSESVSAIESIVDVINEIDEIVSTVATSIEEQSATTREISNNVSQAASGVQEVNENVNQTSQVAGEVTRDVAEVSRAAEEMNTGSYQVNESAKELSKLSEDLNEMVARFKL
ncbi:MAG: methyl-accepting chemotaxis protein [Desulfobacteraceae bacterium]